MANPSHLHAVSNALLKGAFIRQLLNTSEFIMNRNFEKSLCLASGIPFLFLTLLISVLNGFILVVLYRTPLRCFRKIFSVFLVFVCAVDFFNSIVVCSGETDYNKFYFKRLKFTVFQKCEYVYKTACLHKSSYTPAKISREKTIKAPFPHTRIFIPSITILEFLKIAVASGRNSWSTVAIRGAP